MIPLRLSHDVESITSDGLTTLRSRTAQDDALLYFHGFPGPYETPPLNEARVADRVFARARGAFDFYYPLYTVKPAGEFRFTETVRDAERAWALVRRRAYRSVTVIGQSWGAILTAHLLRSFAPSRVVLITPFVMLPRGTTARDLLLHHAAAHPTLLTRPIEECLSEIETLAGAFDPAEIVRRPRVPTTVFAGTLDEIVPHAALAELCASAVRFVSLAGEGHQLADRNGFADEVMAAVNRPVAN